SAELPMCWRSSPDRERPMVRLKRSTAGLNICAGLLWGSVTSPTTSPGVCSSPVASDRFYTLNYDEPVSCVGHPHCVWAWWALAAMALTPTRAVADASTTAPVLRD